jgi:hypothetical protein
MRYERTSLGFANHEAIVNLRLLVLRASPGASAKVPGRLVERHYSLMSFSTNVPTHGPVREGTATGDGLGGPLWRASLMRCRRIKEHASSVFGG